MISRRLTTVAAFNARAAFGFESTQTAARCGCHLPYNDQKIYFDYGGATEGNTRVSIDRTGLWDTLWHTFTFTVGTRGMEIWQDFDRIASNSGHPNRGTQRDNEGWQINRGQGSGGHPQDIEFVYMWNRQLEVNEIRQLVGNPYCFFVIGPR